MRWQFWIIISFCLVSLLADFIANELPIYCHCEGRHRFPIINAYLSELGFQKPDLAFRNGTWHQLGCENVILAPIPYSANTIDGRNAHFKSPFDPQNVTSWHQRHWLGTDGLGRDLAAGMLSGLRIAMFVGISSTLIALLFGFTIGLTAGYFGDVGLRVLWWQLLLLLYFFFTLFFFIFIAGGNIVIKIFILLFILIKILFINHFLKQRPTRTIALPLDSVFMRSVDVLHALPTNFILLGVLSALQPSVWNIVLATSLLGWTSMARYVRAETLKVKENGFVDAARAMGASPCYVLLRHIALNVLSSVLVSAAFCVSSAIMVEAFLSFIGLGLPPDVVTWGSLLHLARQHIAAWWLAVFPGIAIAVTVLSFHAAGRVFLKNE